MPNLKSLYYRDFTIQRAIKTIGFTLFAAAGIKWATQPVESVVKVDHSPLEDWIAQWWPAVALCIAALATLVLVRRYQWIKRVLSSGIKIKGCLEDTDVYTRENSHSDNAPAFQRSYTRTYYVTITYEWKGVEKRIRRRLPNSPSTYQITKDIGVDLIILDSAPDRPLIGAVYLGRF